MFNSELCRWENPSLLAEHRQELSLCLPAHLGCKGRKVMGAFLSPFSPFSLLA